MFKTIADWFSDTKEDMNGLAQQQREAELDLLVLMMYADRNIDQNEGDKIKEESKSFKWENVEYHMELYIDKTMAVVRDAINNESRLNVFIKDIFTRLGDEETRQKALANAEKFMDIDFKISPKEEELLVKIKEIFALD